MNAIPFEQVNCTFTRPESMTDDECGPLPVYREVGDTPGGCLNVSCWQATPEDLAEIQRTGRVWLLVVGPGQPPVALAAFSPFAQKSEFKQALDEVLAAEITITAKCCANCAASILVCAGCRHYSNWEG